MVGHDREVDPLRKVVVEVGLEHLLLVSDEERHHQLHADWIGGRIEGKRACRTDHAADMSVCKATIEWPVLR